MKKAHRAQGFLLGMLVMALMMGLLIPAGAASTKKTITVTTGVPIYVDGVEMKPTDANGNPVETFLYNGTTYVPLRAVSQYLGKAVKWDGSSRSVYIGKAPGEVQYLLDVCPPYQSDELNQPTTMTIAGQKYANCFSLGSGNYWGGWALFNLDGEYSTLSFDMGHIDGERMSETTINIYLDGQLSRSFDVKPEDLPKHYDIPLYGSLQMKIETSNSVHGFVNVEIK